jgi:hypothetical protein
LAQRSGHESRSEALGWLVQAIGESKQALWGIDAPFGLPVELFGPRSGWAAQLRFVARWDGDALALGRHLANRSLDEFGRMHVRRETDRAMRTPFDCYHYRIVHQTFHVMRDVLLRLVRQEGTAVLPFQYGRAVGAQRVVVEACPSSTLLRLGMPRRGYKQPEGGALTKERRSVRRVILRELRRHLAIGPRQAQTILEDPGGDALDSVLAAVGAWHGVVSADHAAIALSPRAPREGRVFA